MRETVSSLRAYFIVVGALVSLLGTVNLIFAAAVLHIARGAVISPIHAWAVALVVLDAIVSVGLGVAFLAMGIRLPKLIRDSSQRIITLLYVALGANVLFFALSAPFGISTFQVVYFAAGLLIVWYLLKNVRRLADEAQHASTL